MRYIIILLFLAISSISFGQKTYLTKNYIKVKDKLIAVDEVVFEGYIDSTKTAEETGKTRLPFLFTPASDGSVLLVREDSLSGGSGIPNRFDLTRLEYIHKNISAVGLEANESVIGYNFSDVNEQKYKFTENEEYGTGGEKGGWLSNGTAGDSIYLKAPHWVLIGDSQAEGHPARHGRLHPGSGQNIFDPSVTDQTGQITYHLRILTNFRWYNHGIGGQTSTQVLARFNRDALGLTDASVSDGRGSKTLESKPQGVVVIAGINDFYTGGVVADVTDNLTQMAILANENNVSCVILNCPGDELNNPTQNRQIDSLNLWLANGNLNPWGAIIVDYNEWWRDPIYDDNRHGNSLIVDDIHPSLVGYDSLSQYIFREAKLPVLDSIYVYTELSPTDPLQGYSRPSSLQIESATYPIASDQQSIKITSSLLSDSVKFKILASTNVTGTNYTGISHIEYLMSNKYAGENIVTRKAGKYAGSAGAVDVSKWNESTGNLSPKNSAKVSIGTSSQHNADAVMTVRGTTTDNRAGFVYQNSLGVAQVYFYNNGKLGIGVAPVYPFDVDGGANFRNGSTYSFIIGSKMQMYGGNPGIDFQSTSAGAFRTMNISYDANGNVFRFAPSSASGNNTNYTFGNLAGDFATLNGITERFGIKTTAPSQQIDLSENILLRGSDDGTTTGKLIMNEAANSNTFFVSLTAKNDLVSTAEYKFGELGTVGDVWTLGANGQLVWQPKAVDTHLFSENKAMTVDIVDTLGIFEWSLKGNTLSDFLTVNGVTGVGCGIAPQSNTMLSVRSRGSGSAHSIANFYDFFGSNVLSIEQSGKIGVGTVNPLRVFTIESDDNDLLHVESTDPLATIALSDNTTTEDIILMRLGDELSIAPQGSDVKFNESSIIKFGDIQLHTGTGSPEAVLVAPVGSIYMRSDGGLMSTMYVKESGAGNTGWVAK